MTHCPPDQVIIFKGDFSCLQAINLTAFAKGDLLFLGGTKFLPVWLCGCPMEHPNEHRTGRINIYRNKVNKLRLKYHFHNSFHLSVILALMHLSER